MQPVTTILVPTDFSAPAADALRYARSLAEVFGASLHLLHVIEDPFAAGTYMGLVMVPPEGYFEHLEQQIHAKLAALPGAGETQQCAVVFATRLGDPAAEIIGYVREHGAIDLIVIASAGRGGVARTVLGSVADKVVRAAPCPVLVVHPRHRVEAGDTERAA